MSCIYRGAKEMLIWIRPAPDLDCMITVQNDHWYSANDGYHVCLRAFPSCSFATLASDLLRRTANGEQQSIVS
jgi:hypothetical protein